MYQIWTNSPEVTSTRRLNVQLSLSPDLFTYVNPEHIKIGSCDLPVRPHWATTAPPHRSHTGPALLRTDGLCQRRLDSSGQVLPGRVSPPPFILLCPGRREARTLARWCVVRQRTGTCRPVASIPSGGQARSVQGRSCWSDGRADQP